MNAIQFIKENGVEKAREVVDGAPDKTATHYVISKRPHYYSVDFQSYFNNGDWHDSDYASEQDLANDYEPQNVIRLSDLKSLVESVGLINKLGGIWVAKEKLTYRNSISAMRLSYETTITGRDGTKQNVITGVYLEDLEQAIADYESIYRGEHV